jgi:glycerophosphoryl diester phosphodiesterase
MQKHLPLPHPKALLLLLLWAVLGLPATPASAQLLEGSFQLQGHRGARGLWPENCIRGFEEALRMGCNWLEMDLAVSRDCVVILSHEPWMNPGFCWKDGLELDPTRARAETNLFRLTYAQIKEYDCGELQNRAFSSQATFPCAKPQLVEVLRQTQRFCQAENLPQCAYNIEIKSQPDWDNLYTPAVPTFCNLVLAALAETGLSDRVVLQSFDVRALQYLRTQTLIPLSYLLEGPLPEQAPLSELFAPLGFVPEVFSPHHSLLTAKFLKKFRQLYPTVKVVPWTVNTAPRMQELLQMGVDGIITDYPNLLAAQHRAHTRRNQPTPNQRQR